MSAREIDQNGFITIKKNPISKVGVFPYLGKSINGSLEPEKIYWVYRPAEELGHPDTIKSFQMVPIINDHTMLGKGFTPAEEKGVDGVTGEDVLLEGDILYSDLRIFSESLKKEIDVNGKTELSMGYRVGEWDPTPGQFDGKFYDFVQRKIRGNHIALVEEGRMGSEIAVLDGITFDSMEVSKDTASDNTASPTAAEKGDADVNKKGTDMAEEEKKAMSMDDVKAFIKGHAKDRKTFDKLMDEMRPAAEDGDTEEKEGDQEKAKDADEEKKKEGLDAEIEDADEEKAKDAEEDKDKKATDEAIKGLRQELVSFKKNGMKQLMTEINKRNALATEVEECFGTFDHAEKTVAEVAAYGLDKANIKGIALDHAPAVWSGFYQGRRSKGSGVGSAMDHKNTKALEGSLIQKTLNASK